MKVKESFIFLFLFFFNEGLKKKKNGILWEKYKEREVSRLMKKFIS